MTVRGDQLAQLSWSELNCCHQRYLRTIAERNGIKIVKSHCREHVQQIVALSPRDYTSAIRNARPWHGALVPSNHSRTVDGLGSQRLKEARWKAQRVNQQ